MRPRLPISIALLVIFGSAACGGERSSEATVVGDAYPVSGYAHAGPTCPVMQDPPEAGCEDRAVEGAELLVLDASATQTADVRTAADGTFNLTLPPGRYTLVPQPVEGLLGTAEPQDFLVDAAPVIGLDLAYDTGIRCVQPERSRIQPRAASIAMSTVTQNASKVGATVLLWPTPSRTVRCAS